MKRWTIGSIAFFATLAISIVLVWPVSLEQETQQKIPPSAIPEEIILSEPQEDNFVPEFRDLPNIEEIDAANLTARLVDVRENGNEFRKSEIVAKSGETWLGLNARGDRLELRNQKVKVLLHHKASDPDYEDWFRFDLPKKEIPLFLIKGAASIKPDRVRSLYLRPSPSEVADKELEIKTMSRGYDRSFLLDGTKYTFRVTSGSTSDDSEVNVLVLETEFASQIVTYNSYFKDTNTNYNEIGDLLWVGDLDGDGKLDFYLSEFGFEKGGFGSSLYLSSMAENGQLVKLVASFGTSGC